jgi:hypothetical protein
MSISRVGFTSITALILRSKRQYITALNKTISELNRNNSTNTLFVKLNNVTSLFANQVGRINITPTSNLYNNVVGRMLNVSGTATYGNLTFITNTITSTITETTLLGGVGNVVSLPAFITGTAVSFSSVGTLSGLTAGTTYYVYGYSSTSPNNFGSCKLASSYANAINGVPITGTGIVTNSVCSVAPIAANTTEGVIVYGVTNVLTTSTSFITAGTPVSFSNVTGLTGITAGTIYYLYGAVANGVYSWFRLANTFADAIAGTPVFLSGASQEMAVNATGTATSNSVTIYSTISDTYTSGGTFDPVAASGAGGNRIGIFFDKDDDLSVVTTTGQNKNIAVLNFIRSGPPGEGTFGLFYDDVLPITQKVTIAPSSSNINIGENISTEDATFNLFSGSSVAATRNATRTINIGTGYSIQNIGTSFKSTTNITLGNYNSTNSSSASITFINARGKLKVEPWAGSYAPFETSSWTTAGAGFELTNVYVRDITSAASSTIATRTSASFATPAFASTNAITVTNGVNVYVAAGPTTGNNTAVTNSWALYAEGVTRLNQLRVDSNIGFYGTTPIAKATALTTAIATITPPAYTLDSAIQGVTSTSPFGFVNANEGNTLINVVANLQTRVNELETKLRAYGLLV